MLKLISIILPSYATSISSSFLPRSLLARPERAGHETHAHATETSFDKSSALQRGATQQAIHCNELGVCRRNHVIKPEFAVDHLFVSRCCRLKRTWLPKINEIGSLRPPRA